MPPMSLSQVVVAFGLFVWATAHWWAEGSRRPIVDRWVALVWRGVAVPAVILFRHPLVEWAVILLTIPLIVIAPIAAIYDRLSTDDQLKHAEIGKIFLRSAPSISVDLDEAEKKAMKKAVAWHMRAKSSSDRAHA